MYAASFTVLATGPIVSYLKLIGMTILLDIKPSVGLIPTTLLRSASKTMLQLISVASAPSANPIDAAIALPLELPLGSGFGW